MGLLEDFASFIVFQLLGMEHGDALAESLNFFIYDSIKVSLLLVFMIFIVSFARAYITREKIKKLLGGKKEGVGNVLAAVLGIPTPFCSCSAVPIFMGFMESGIPLGVTFSFLIASPMINEIALALLLAEFGIEVALIYVITGLAIAVIAGIIIGRLKLEKEIEKMKLKGKGRISNGKMNVKKAFEFARGQTSAITKKVLPYIFIGIGVGSLIHGYVPVGFLSEIAGPENPFAVPIAVLVGIPLYSNAAGTMPIIQALMSKGMALGTALALMMSITALSFPEMIMLRNVLKPKLIAIFVLVLAISFIITGLLFNAIL